MHYGTLVNEFTDRYMAVKKIRVSESTIRDAVKNIITFIHCINNLDEAKTSTPDGTQLSNIMIPAEMKDIVEPSAIRVYPGDRRCEDLRLRDDFKPCVFSTSVETVKDEENGEEVRKEVEKFKVCDLDTLRIHILDDISILRNSQKKNGSEDLVSIESCRKEVSLMDVLPRVSKEGLVTQEGNYFIPLSIKGCQGLFTDRFYTQDADFTIKEYVRSVIQ